MRFVATKSEQQQSGLMLHRSRQLLVCQRTMLTNAIRGRMAELGIICAKGRNGTAELLRIIADEHAIRAASIGRTHDRTRPMLHQQKKALVQSGAVHT